MRSINKKDSSAGRARGFSMLSPLKTMNQDLKAGSAPQHDHPGISFERIRPQDIGKVTAGAGVRPSLVTASGRVVSESQISALTMALQAAGVGETAGSRSDGIATKYIATKAITTKDIATNAITIKTASSSHGDTTPPGDSSSPGDTTPPGLSTDESASEEESIPMPARFYYEQPDLRKWCTGQPPKKSYLTSDADFLPRIRKTRRNTLADKPELDNLLAATKVEYNGHYYLPLTAVTIHRLDPFFKGAKPLADMKLFECIIINQEVNGVHADHVVAGLERIGEHCKHLLVMSPVQTSELGNVFAREADNINTGNDWDAILGCFPNLNFLAFVHDVHEPVGLAGNTFRGLRAAVARRQATQEHLKGFSFNGPPALLM